MKYAIRAAFNILSPKFVTSVAALARRRRDKIWKKWHHRRETKIARVAAALQHTWSMLWSIDSCQNKVSADVTISRAQVGPYQGQLFFWSGSLTRDWLLIGSQAQARSDTREVWIFARFLRLNAATQPCTSAKTLDSRCFSRSGSLENIFFLHFSLVSIQVWHNIAVVSTHWWLGSYSSQALEGYKRKAECLFSIPL